MMYLNQFEDQLISVLLMGHQSLTLSEFSALILWPKFVINGLHLTAVSTFGWKNLFYKQFRTHKV